MLTRRSLLQGTGATALLPLVPARAAGGAGAIRIETSTRPLASLGGPTPTLRMTGPEQDGALRLDPGRSTALQCRNATAEPIALQWRGLRGVGSLEQAPETFGPGTVGALQVMPRDGGTALLRAAADAAHPAARGAQAVVVVPDVASLAVDRDMVVMLADWLLAADNSLRFGSVPPADVVLGAITVNGEPRANDTKLPPGARVRLRFVNASVQRLMIVACVGARPMIAAIDGQPSELFAPVRNTIPLGPSARYDLLLDMPEAAGSQVRFTLKPTMTVGGKVEAERDLLVLSAEGAPLPPKPALAPFPPNPALPVQIPLETARRVALTFAGQPATPMAAPAGWSVTTPLGRVNDKPVLAVRRGDAVVLGLVNASPTLVPLRIGGHAVRLLHAKDDGWEPYWRDTLLLPPGSRTHVAFVADVEGLWPIDSGFDDLTLAGLSCSFRVDPR